MDGTKENVEQSGTMGMDDLFDGIERLDLVGIILGVFVRQHDETFMVIHPTKRAQVEGGFVAGIKVREADEQRIKGRRQADIPAVLASLQA